MPLVMIKSDRKAREKPCLRCGYSLRRIDSQHCPECGLSTWRSLNGNDVLEWSHPVWLVKVSRACAVLAAVQFLGMLVYAQMNLFSFAPAVRSDWLVLLSLRAQRWMGLSAAVYEAALAGGLLMLGAYEGRHPDKWKPYRVACRIVAGVLLLISIWSFVSSSKRWGSAHWRHQHVLQMLLNLSIIAGTLASFAYLRMLAKRIPSSRAVWWSGCLLLAPAASLLKTVPIFSVFLAFEFSGLLFAYLPLLYLPITTGFLIYFTLAFRKSARAAAQGWDAETANATSVSIPSA